MASFWNDNWSGVGVAKAMYPRLYALENHKEVNVRAKFNDSSLDRSFRRQIRGGAEQVQFDALVSLASSVNLVPRNDRLVWALESSGDFSVASIRKIIDGFRLKSDKPKTRWIKHVPIKTNVLAWKIKMDALPTRLNISKRGIDIQSISCPICDDGIESSDHLFFRCHLAKQLAGKISSWWCIDYVDVNSYEEWCTWMLSLRIASKIKMLFEGVFYAMWWSLWTYRNKLIFEDKAPPNAFIFDNIVSNSFYWCKFRSKASISWIEWLKNPYLITL